MSPPEVGLGRIPDRVKEEIRERADIAQVVGRYVTLKKSGNRFWGLCPFHSEKTPSFSVHPDKQMFHCFGCGEGGDVFSFRMKVDGTGFMETLRSLAGEFSVALPASSEDERESRSAPIYKANEVALEYFRAGLRGPAGRPAREYLAARGVPADLIDRFQVGFAPPGWDGLLNHIKRHGVSIPQAEEAGLIVPRQNGDGHYDRFRGRVMFPIAEPNGRVVGFGGRGLADETPKYLNSSESPVYRKGRALFGLNTAVDAIRQRNRVVIVEGYFDLIALHRAGLAEAVAPCGTALTADHARRLRRYSREVVLLFDGDDAGRKAAERSLPHLADAGLRVRAAFLPNGEDPDTLLEKHGPGALAEAVDAALPLLDTLIDDRLGMRPLHEWEAADLASELGPLVAAVPDEIERAAYVRRIATRLGLDTTTVTRALQSEPRVQRAQGEAKTAAPELRTVRLDATSRSLLGALGSYPELVSVVAEFGPEALPDGPGGELLGQVVGVLRDAGRDGLTELLSGRSEQLPEEFRSVLRHALAETELEDKATAERVIRDCVAALRMRQLEEEAKRVSLRLESCRDRAEEDQLLERKQQILRERSALAVQVRTA